MRRVYIFLIEHEIIIVFFFMLVFITINVQGLSWGTPSLWHPDEIIHRVILALEGNWQFDEINFDYPSLPKYIMYILGNMMFAQGYSIRAFIIAARLISVLLGAGVIGLTYLIVKKQTDKRFPAIGASLLLISNQHLAINSHWAHNDLYVTFFVTLAVFTLQKFVINEHKGWLYASFFVIGLASSSKYNAASLILAPVVVFLVNRFGKSRKLFPDVFETLLVSGMLCFLGYAVGTPKSALWLAFYLKRVIPALSRHAAYGRGPDSVIGILGQWRVMRSLLGLPLFVLTSGAVLYITFDLIKEKVKQIPFDTKAKGMSVLLLSLLVLDLPILISYNIQERFFLPLLPLLTAIVAIVLERVVEIISNRGYPIFKAALVGVIGAIVVFNFLKVISTTLLFYNDSRIAASEYIETLPAGTRIEYTLYPPTISKEQFSGGHNYPLFFIKFPDQEIPQSPFYDFNVGEAGVNERNPDYLVLDSFTYKRFHNEYTCSLHPQDCGFFERLQAGETNYELLERFSYTLPWYLPNPGVSFLNPDIEIYQRED